MTAIQSVGPNMPPVSQYQQGQPMYNMYYPEVLEVQEFPDCYVYTLKDEASGGKKWGVGLGSFFLPGLGQAINGQWGKAAGFFGGSIAATVVANKNLLLGGLAGLGVSIWSIVDAVKSAHSKTKQIVPKEQNINMQG